MKVPFSFLTDQFESPDTILSKIRESLKRCDFTLGKDLTEFEKKYAKETGCKHAIGVGSGTDALFLSLKAVGVGSGDEVITVPNSFIATTGAVVQAGARPVYVDCDASLNIDPEKIEAAITPKTKAILPVHWAGGPCAIEEILKIANKHGIPLVEDACQALGAEWDGKKIGSFGMVAGFSVHPLKPLHVWGDGGVITTNDDAIASRIQILRNHGLVDRDTVSTYGYNSRFDNVQAIVGNCVFETLEATIEKRIRYAKVLDEAFSTEELRSHITLPSRAKEGKHVFHLYQFQVKERDKLLKHLIENGIEAKIHYPIPLHLQPAAHSFGYRKGDFPCAERQSEQSITLPCHQYLNENHLQYMIDTVSNFFL